MVFSAQDAKERKKDSEELVKKANKKHIESNETPRSMRTVVCLTPEEHKAIAELAIYFNTSASSLMHDLACDYIKKHKKELEAYRAFEASKS